MGDRWGSSLWTRFSYVFSQFLDFPTCMDHPLQKESCPRYKEEGLCKSNEKHMKYWCAKTCGFCKCTSEWVFDLHGLLNVGEGRTAVTHQQGPSVSFFNLRFLSFAFKTTVIENIRFSIFENKFPPTQTYVLQSTVFCDMGAPDVLLYSNPFSSPQPVQMKSFQPKNSLHPYRFHYFASTLITSIFISHTFITDTLTSDSYLQTWIGFTIVNLLHLLGGRWGGGGGSGNWGTI